MTTVSQAEEASQRRVRIAQITSELAEMKRQFFAEGVERPMSVRVTLEAELATLRMQAVFSKEAGDARRTMVRQLRGKLLYERLVAMGYPNLINDCNDEAERLVLNGEKT